jgi:hypothetical protein
MQNPFAISKAVGGLTKQRHAGILLSRNCPIGMAMEMNEGRGGASKMTIGFQALD